MSTAKFEQRLYKPEYDSQRPIIVDDELGSPETAALRYEEEALRANGGDYRGDSPPSLLPMATFKPQPTQLHGFADSPYSQYSTQSFSTQQTDNTAGHINQVAYGAGNSTSQYIATQTNGGLNLTVLSCQPATGTYGTKMLLKVSALYDLQSLATEPYAWMTFGSYRTPAQIVRGPQAADGAWTYTVNADVPQFISTNCASPKNVPLGLVIESNGDELTRLDNAGFFTYHDTHSGSVAAAAVTVADSGDNGPHEGPMRKRSLSPEHSSAARQRLHIRTHTSPLSSQQISPIDSATNTYGYPPGVDAAHAQAQAQAQVQADSAFAAGTLSQDSGSMLGAYRSTGYGHYSRAPPALRSRRSSGWTAYSGHYDSVHGSSAGLGYSNHTAIARPGPSSIQHNGGPQLIRTSTLSSLPGSSAVGGAGYNNPYATFPTKATLEISGDLEKMAEKWTQEEWDNRRRIVVFKKNQQGSHIQTTFRAVPLAERPPNSICISCIYWAEKQECFVTSVDTIHLLEQLVVAPARFTVEEKNRIRRNLEGFHPLTVSKGKSESEDFFKIIMAFGNPKPRNIEKDVKVFRWKDLAPALKKIISKYSQSPSSTVGPASMPTPLLTPVSLSGSYPTLPPAPGSATTSTDPATANGYITSAHHHNDSIPSPRSISGIGSSWVGYPAPSRTISPGMKLNSPATSSAYRVAPLPAVYDTRTTAQHATSPYGVPSSSTHHVPSHTQNGYSQTMMPLTTSHSRNWDGGRSWEGDYNSSRNWDGYSVGDGYSTSNRMHSNQTPVYSGGHSGDGASRI